MTINSQANKTIVAGDGVQTQFAFSFVGVSAAYITVILTSAAGAETILSRGSGATQYQIALNAPVPGAIWGLGGTVTYNPSGTPIAAGSTLTMFRTLPLTQAISLQNQASLETLGDGAEAGLDTLEMQLQQIYEMLSRAVLANITNPVLPDPLPSAASAAGKGVIFSADGSSLVAGEIPASGFISVAMAPVVAAATLAAARAAFGLGAAAVEGIGSGLSDDGAGNLRINEPITAVATNQAIGAGAAYARFAATGPITFSLARANTLWNGFGFWIVGVAGNTVLTPDPSDTIFTQASGTSIVIPAGVAAYVTTDAAGAGTWYIDYMQATAGSTTSGSFTGLVANNDGATPGTKWNISATSLVVPNAVGGALRINNPAISIITSNTGLNGLDAGTLTINTWYNWFVIAKANGAYGGLLSLSATAPALPPGYTFFKRLGALRVDGSGNLKRLIQRGARLQYVGAGGYPQIASGVAVFGAVSTLAAVPLTAVSTNGVLNFNGANVGAATVFASNSAVVIAQGAANGVNTNLSVGIPFECMQEDPANLFYAAGGAGFGAANVQITGFTDNI